MQKQTVNIKSKSNAFNQTYNKNESKSLIHKQIKNQYQIRSSDKNSINRDFEEINGRIKEMIDKMPGENWFRLGYGIFVTYMIILFVRYIYAISWLKPIVITNNFLLIAVCVLLPFVLWAFSTKYDRWLFYDPKKRWLYTAVVSAIATLEQPLVYISHQKIVSRIMEIPVTENMTADMVVLLARVSMILPLIAVTLIVAIPLYNTLISTEVQEKIEDFRITQQLDLRKNKENLYDLHIIRDLKNGALKIIKEADRFVHMFINGQTGTGKTSSTIIPAVAEDLNTKVRNMEAREKELLYLLKERKAYIAGPFAKVDETNIRPVKGYEKEYQAIYEKYPDCGITVMAPNNDMNNTIVKLCEARGLPVNVIDPAKSYVEKNARAKGMANFYIPEGLSEEEEAIRIIEQAETFSEVIVATNERSGEGEQYFRDINTSITTNIAIVCMLAARITGRDTDINEVNVCVHNFKELEDKVNIIEDYFDFSVDITTIDKKRGGISTDDLKDKLKKKEMTPKNNGKTNPYYTILVDVKKDLLGPGAEKMEDQTRGLRVILDKILRDQRFNRILSTPREKSVDFDEILKKNEITVINTALEFGESKSSALGIMTLLNFSNAVLRRPKETRSNHFIWIDESSQYMHRVIENMYALFRQYRVGVALAMQSTSQIDKYRTTAYLKSVILGAGTQILFGRASAEEMKLYEQLAGEKIEENIQKTISQTSLFTSTASQNESERMLKETNKVVTGRNIRKRNFQEVTVFKINEGKVEDGFLGKCSFLDKKELENQPVRHINFAKLVPNDKVKKEIKLSEPAKTMIIKKKEYINEMKESVQIISLDNNKPMFGTEIEETKELNVSLKRTITDPAEKKVIPNKDINVEVKDLKNMVYEMDKENLIEVDEEDEEDSVDEENSIFGNLFEPEEKEFINMDALEEEIQELEKRQEEEL